MTTDTPMEQGVIEINDSTVQIIEPDETAEQVTEIYGDIIPESNTADTTVTVIETDENTDIFDELDETAASEDETDEDIDPDSETDDENADPDDDTNLSR